MRARHAVVGHRTFVVGVLAATLAGTALAGCAGEGEPVADPTTLFPSSPTTAPSPSTSRPATGSPSPAATAAGTDVRSVPDEISASYVEQLYAALMDVYAPVLDAVVNAPDGTPPSPPEGAVATVSSIATSDARDSLLATLDRAVAQPADPAYVDTYRGPRLTDTTVLYAGESCLIAAAHLDFGASGVQREPIGSLVALSFVRSRPGDPTAWRLTRQLPNDDADGAPNPDEVLLDADLSLLGDLFEHDCTEDDDARP